VRLFVCLFVIVGGGAAVGSAYGSGCLTCVDIEDEDHYWHCGCMCVVMCVAAASYSPSDS